MRCVTTVRCLKDRYTGRATGKTFELRYDQDSGILEDLGINAFGGPKEVNEEDQKNPFEKGTY